MAWPEHLPEPVSVRQQAQHIALALSEWAAENDATVTIMSTMQQLWMEVLETAREDRTRLLICWVGEISRGGDQMSNLLHRVDRSWLVVLLRGRSLAAYESLGKTMDETDDKPSFLDVCETVRDKLRAILSISEENPITYVSMKPLPNPAGSNTKTMFMDGMAIEFKTANDIPVVLSG